MPSQKPKVQRSSHYPSKRVKLRPLAETEVVEIASWLEEAGDSGTNIEKLAITSLSDGELIGVLSYRVGLDRAISIEAIVVTPKLRARGYGSEAVRLLEAEKIAEGVARKFQAEVDGEHGLCLYFWLRLGYKPQLDNGILVMTRSLD